MHVMKKACATFALTGSILLAGGALAGPASAQPINIGDNLVNVQVGNITILRNVDVAVAANLVANICNFDVTAVILAADVVDDGGNTFTCEAGRNGQDISIVQN